MRLKRTAALVALLLGAAPAAGFVTRVSSTIALSDAADSSLLCPSGSPLGGGFDSAAFGVLTSRGSGIAEPALPSDPVTRWALETLNPTGTFQDFRTVAVCGNLPGLVYVFEDSTTPAGSPSSESVLCPLGTVAISGGALTDGFPIDARLTASGPYFPAIPIAPLLSDRPDGEAPLPGGWRVSHDNVGSATLETVFAACADWDEVHPIVESRTVAAGDAEVAIATCPAGTSAVAGGFDATNRVGLRLAASSPLFAGFPLVDGIFDVTGSTTELAIAWRVVVRNEGVSAKTFQVAAICVPEPATPAVTAVAVLAGLVAARRSRAIG